MHEYSIVSALLEQCHEYAVENKVNKITQVTVKIGVLSGVEPSLFATAFETFKLEGVAYDAKLVIQQQAIILQCHHCQAEVEIAERSVKCPQCDSFDTQIIAGEEMLLMQLEMEQA
ncbi:MULTISPECIES: hydrogenase maturation nickel metallochaperone HypA [Shewanella]|uniref:hydrogenase maturation nickel metallochaperone HypA n=1 Tax=Shewanella TaxID=22 RepID=UPI0004920929|nr:MULTISPECIES: hydrogenase maturation nickel metallochaperone HypA [Shewanella]QLE85769.1 hydrogenase maturation nickel metallochaperone HypA [Shewanella sp. Scap07]